MNLNKLMFVVIMLIVGSFVTFAAMASDGPINYNEQDKMLVTPAVCQAHNDSMHLALMSYAVGVKFTEVVTILDKGILENIKDDDQYLGRTMTSMNIANAVKIVSKSAAFQTPTMADRLQMAEAIVNDAFISCRQEVGKTRGAYRRT